LSLILALCDDAPVGGFGELEADRGGELEAERGGELVGEFEFGMPPLVR
jgi:hypothetical protein